MASDSRYVVGIDLGTTNTAVAYIDTADIPDDAHRDMPPPVQTFDIPQVTAPGTVENRPSLPSFLYLPNPHELPEGSLALPWDAERDFAVGEFARNHGARLPQHLVSSAKSWLCHDGVDRRDPILPWGAEADVAKMSPIEATAQYLRHIREAWDATHDVPLEDHDIILCVPASFDAVARELTMEASLAAGLLGVTLLEEPQAAFYSWLQGMGKGWRTQVQPGDVVLVCDIGGGTTDFSLIAVRDDGGDLSLERIAVGDHILLGGDNMDLTLAVHVAQRLKAEGHKLDGWQMQVLTQSCRVAKERLLQDDGPSEETVVVPGRGSSLIGGAVQTELSQEDAQRVLLDGFFPIGPVSKHAARSRRVGLQELGLPYESDAAITRHLARFLSIHLGALERLGVELQPNQTFVHPTAILFNGGVVKNSQIRRRLIEVVNGWLTEAGANEVRVLEGPDLDLAVARGAASYGLVRRGRGIRIRGGTARAYYIGLEVPRPAVPGMPPPLKALCVAPYGMEEGSRASLPSRDFVLVVGEPAEFKFMGSPVRRDDNIGTEVEDWEDTIEEITTIHATLDAEGKAGTLLPVRLESNVTEIGTLELWCAEKNGPGRWKLEFDVREKEPVA